MKGFRFLLFFAAMSLLLMTTPIFANSNESHQFGVSIPTTQEFKDEDSDKKVQLREKRDFKVDEELERELKKLTNDITEKNGEVQFDENKYIWLKDKKGKSFIVDKKYLKYLEDVSDIDLSESRATIPNIFENITKNEPAEEQQPTKEKILKDINSPDAIINSWCDGTGPIGDCRVETYKEERIVTKKQYLYSEWRPDIEIIGDIPVPIFKKVDICYILFDKYRTPRYRCDYQGCVTYVTGPKEYVGEFASPDMDCDDLPDVGQKF